MMQKHSSQKIAELLKIQENYPKYFEQIFIESQLSHLAMIHPLTILFREQVNDGTLDSSDIAQIYNTDIFQEYFSKNSSLLKQLDPNSIMLEGTFSLALGRMEVFEHFAI